MTSVISLIFLTGRAKNVKKCEDQAWKFQLVQSKTVPCFHIFNFRSHLLLFFLFELLEIDKMLPKYNGKLMNSIWGQYNLYAAHAFQKNSEGSFGFMDPLNIPQVK